jgi:hypothetical protein
MCDVNVNLRFLNALQLTAHFSEEADKHVFVRKSLPLHMGLYFI